ncbi:MAG: sigma-70 family RNA polymerase sigma factor [Leptospirales bacterium]|nr:sigma-70 family RNA polymerase sigma factor [Leptospirales bacterium]
MQGPGGEDEAGRLTRLMVLSQQGDNQAYNIFLKEVSVRTRPYIRSRIADSDAVEDVVQEVLVSIHRTLATYDPTRPILPWLWAIVRYRIVDYARRKNRQLDGPGSFDAAFENLTAPSRSESDSMGELILQSVAKLPEKQKRAFELTKMQGMSVREAARELNMTETATKVTVHRAKRTLRKIMRSLGYDNG